MADLVPYLTFRDGNKSLRFLSEALGFETVSVQRDERRGVVHAELRRGEAVVMGGESRRRPAERPASTW